MTDIKSIEERSRNMSAIKSKDTSPEVFLRKRLFAKGYRYRKNVKTITGHPDLYLAKYHTAIFIHGCFWHRHPNCKYAYMPKSNSEFWMHKFLNNIERDRRVQKELSSKGIRYIIVWECTIRKMRKSDLFADEIIALVSEFLTSTSTYIEI